MEKTIETNEVVKVNKAATSTSDVPTTSTKVIQKANDTKREAPNLENSDSVYDQLRLFASGVQEVRKSYILYIFTGGLYALLP